MQFFGVKSQPHWLARAEQVPLARDLGQRLGAKSFSQRAEGGWL
jgi:hypothetical protein